MEPVLMFQMTPLEKEPIAQVGGMKLSKATYLLEMVLPDSTTSIIKMETQHPLSTSDDGIYISFDKALQLSGLQEDILRELCETGKIEAKQMENDWMILWNSLKRYLYKHKHSS